MVGSKKPQENQVLKAYLACRDALVRSLLKMRAREEDVDDILQETFLRVMHANDKTQIKSAKGYLFTVSRNLVLEGHSQRSREINMEITDALVSGDDVPADRTLHYKRKLEMFNDALRSLPENKRRAILLRKFYGMSHAEVAKKMSVSVSSVEKYISSGMKLCKRTLKSKGYEFEGNEGVLQTNVQNTHKDTGSNGGND